MLKNVSMAISGHKSQVLYLDFNIFKNLASLSLFNLKYALLAQLIKLFLIKRNIFFLCFLPLWVPNYAKGKNFILAYVRLSSF